MTDYFYLLCRGLESSGRKSTLSNKPPKANKNEFKFIPRVSSKWTARVELHISKQIDALEVFFPSFDSLQYNGPANSNPVWANGRSSETLQAGNGWKQYGCPSTFWHITHKLTIVFTTCLPHSIQYRSQWAISVSFMPPCFTLICISVTNNLTNWY